MTENNNSTSGYYLNGRDEPIETSQFHFVNGLPLKGPWPFPHKIIYLAMGCFWGAERLFWQTDGVLVTAVGYSGGETPNPLYDEICSGKTGHTETVMVVYDPNKIHLEQILTLFFENHDPTQGMRQGNDIGPNYRSAIYVTNQEDLALAEQIKDKYQQALAAHGKGKITTEISTINQFYYAESYHQQYLAKNPQGYCNLQGTGVRC